MFCTGVVFFALVGGNYTNGVKAGLWYWNLNETSTNSWTTIGARLLIWYLVCIEHFLHYFLVGGCFDIASYCGIIVVSCLDNSSLLNISRGARLLIRDLMCLSAVYCKSCRR